MIICVMIQTHRYSYEVGPESGLRALAMAMATEPEINRPVDWSAGTLEERYYDALQNLYIQYLGYEEANYSLTDNDLSDIIFRWGRRYKDTYNLYIDNEDDIQLASSLSKSIHDSKTILVRRSTNGWQACCHFEAAGSSVSTLLVDSSPNQHLKPQPLVNAVRDELSSCATETAPEEQVTSAHEVNNNSTAGSPTAEDFLTALKRLVSSVQVLTLAIETHYPSADELHTAIHGFAALIKVSPGAAQTGTDSDIEEFSDECDSEPSTELEIAPNTSLTVQDAGAVDHSSDQDDCKAPITISDEEAEFFAFFDRNFGRKQTEHVEA